MWPTDFRNNGMNGGQTPCMQFEIMIVDYERNPQMHFGRQHAGGFGTLI